MKWVALIVILIVVVLIFGIVRRMQAESRAGRIPGRASDVTEQPAPGLTASAAAAEESADEVPGTPSSEQPPVVEGDDHPDHAPDHGWWQDDQDRREPTS